MNRSSGFSLIEIMIVVAIVGILAGIAYPSYQNHIRETRRTDALEALGRLAAAQERYFFANNKYTTTMSELGYSDNKSAEGYYSLIAVTPPNSKASSKIECEKGGSTYPCFRITATATGAQASDTECHQFAIDHTGKKFSFDNNSTDNSASGVCW